MGLEAPVLDKRYKNCCICGETFKTKPSHWERRKTCSRECDNERRKEMYAGENNPNYENRGPKNPMFKGGRRVTSRGYIVIYKPHHPNAEKNGYILEHRYVMSEHIGRSLRNEEIIHHKDKNKQNNDISNLEITNLSEHSKLHNKEKMIVRCSETGRILGIIPNPNFNIRGEQ